MRSKRRMLILGMSSFLMLAALGSGFFLVRGNAHASPASSTSFGTLTLVGDTVIGQGGAGNFTVPTKDATPTEVEHDIKVANQSGGAPPPPTTAPDPAASAVASATTGFSGFSGLSHADQRLAGTGTYANTQFSLEPPDQGLCVGNGYVVEGVNNALAVYRASDNTRVSGPTALSQFYNLTPEIDRTTGVQGEFISDPKCVYDYDTNRWFFTELEEDAAPSVRTHTLIAVSKTGDPTGSWTIFSFDTTDDGQNNTPSHANCPCLGDQPLIGLDHFGFYITTNEFGQQTGFDGAQVYAISKYGLVVAAIRNGSIPQVVHIDAANDLAADGGLAYSLQPAIAPFGGDLSDDQWYNEVVRNHGTEYFLSALDFNASLDNRVAVWALTNTLSLITAHPNVTLQHRVIASETYGQPPNATQKDGPTPLRDLIATPNNPVTGAAYNDPLEVLNANDDRMNQVVYSDGKLFSAVNTIVRHADADARVGVAYFVVKPTWAGATLNARMAQQGYLAVDGENVLFPSIAVNAFGEGALGVTLSGPDYYPSTAYIHISGRRGTTGALHIAGLGAAPEDGFTGYVPFAPDNVARWGDYSAAVADMDGSIWLANEYIPSADPAQRTSLANWGTFISHVSNGIDD